MKINQNVVTLIYPSSSGNLLGEVCSGPFWNQVRRAPLLAIVLGVAVVLAQVVLQQARDLVHY